MENVLVPFVAAWQIVYPLVGNLIVALFFLAIGYLVARGLALGVTFVLKLAQLDKGLKKIGLSALVEKAEIKRTVSELIGDLVYWSLLLVTVIGVAWSFGLPVEMMIGRLLTYVGRALIAATVLGIGLFLASLVNGLVKLVVLNFGIEGGKTFSRAIYYLIVLLSVVAALTFLGIKAQIFLAKIDVLIGAVGLAAAIAFGLGCKDMAADFLHSIFKGK